MAELILIFVAFMLAGWIQGVLGFGFIMVTTLLLINHIDFTTLVFLNLSMSLLTSLVAFVSVKNIKSIHTATLIKLIGSASVGLALGIALVRYVDADILEQITLLSILIASIISLSKSKNKVFFSPPYVSWIVGFISGVLTPSTGINGPPVALHLNAVFTDKKQTRNTMLAYLLLIMAFGVVSMSFQTELPPQTWSMLPKVAVPSVLGFVLGMGSFRLFSDIAFRWTVTLFLIGSSIGPLIYLMT